MVILSFLLDLLEEGRVEETELRGWALETRPRGHGWGHLE